MSPVNQCCCIIYLNDEHGNDMHQTIRLAMIAVDGETLFFFCSSVCVAWSQPRL